MISPSLKPDVEKVDSAYPVSVLGGAKVVCRCIDISVTLLSTASDIVRCRVVRECASMPAIKCWKKHCGFSSDDLVVVLLAAAVVRFLM